MSENEELLKEFEQDFLKVDPDDPPRPELFGHTKLVRHVHQLEQQIAYLRREITKRNGIPIPKSPMSAYERWSERREDGELDSLLGDIFEASPAAFGMNVN